MNITTLKLIAWSVHLFTASGILAAFLALIAVDHLQWKEAYIWLLVCFIIDSLDGSLARRFDVEGVLPDMDGKSIDFVIDFMAYAVIPAFFFYKAEMVSSWYMPFCISIILLSSALYYGKKDMVCDEQFFMGFPVLWNFVIFFQFFILHNHEIFNVVSVVFFGLLHFAPIRFAYPSRTRRFFWAHFLSSIIGLAAAATVLLTYPDQKALPEIIVCLGGAYFLLFAVFDTLYSAPKNK